MASLHSETTRGRATVEHGARINNTELIGGGSLHVIPKDTSSEKQCLTGCGQNKKNLDNYFRISYSDHHAEWRRS